MIGKDRKKRADWEMRHRALIESARLHNKIADQAERRGDQTLADQERLTAQKAQRNAVAMQGYRPRNARL